MPLGIARNAASATVRYADRGRAMGNSVARGHVDRDAARHCGLWRQPGGHGARCGSPRRRQRRGRAHLRSRRRGDSMRSCAGHAIQLRSHASGSRDHAPPWSLRAHVPGPDGPPRQRDDGDLDRALSVHGRRPVERLERLAGVRRSRIAGRGRPVQRGLPVPGRGCNAAILNYGIMGTQRRLPSPAGRAAPLPPSVSPATSRGAALPAARASGAPRTMGRPRRTRASRTPKPRRAIPATAGRSARRRRRRAGPAAMTAIASPASVAIAACAAACPGSRPARPACPTTVAGVSSEAAHSRATCSCPRRLPPTAAYARASSPTANRATPATASRRATLSRSA